MLNDSKIINYMKKYIMTYLNSKLSKSDDELLLRENVTLKEPSLYHVIMLNDDYTSMDFVILILQNIFYKTVSESQNLMIEVHTKGKSIVGTFTYDVAHTKVSQVKEFSKKDGFPLKCIIEEK
jgi:ATP-dependent Clp protease adaptor protein ClpS